MGLRIKTPANARNTDGIDPSGADVTINDSYIQDGDDGVAIKAGSSASDNMTIENSHFYGTHGISIGSETNAGVNNIMFKNDTLSGTDSSGIESTSNNGMRIKSYAGVGGVVSTVTYEDICMTGVQDLLDFNPFYATATGTAISGSGSVPSCSFPSFPGL